MDCLKNETSINYFSKIDTRAQVEAFQKIQIYVLVTIFIILLQLGYLIKPASRSFFRILSWISYLSVPALISYILGLMGHPTPGYGLESLELKDHLRYLTCIWVIFLLFAYTAFDNLNAFTLEERSGRAKLVLRALIQLVLLLLVLYLIPPNSDVIPIVGVFLVFSLRFVERLVALAHSDGATPKIKRSVQRIIDYANQHDDTNRNATTMEGFKYLVGPRNMKLYEGDNVIDHGITLEKVWDCKGRLLYNGHPQLKDSCLSFALFWLLLGKFWSYPLYEQNNNSKDNAWKLVKDALLAEKGNGTHERVFRVIEVELAFLRDYFHAKYIFFYLNGFSWKLISIVASPIMFWWFTHKAIDYQLLESYTEKGYSLTLTSIANWIVLSMFLAMEALQLAMFLTSKWFEVTLICYYVGRKSTLKDTRFGFPCWFLETIGSLLLGSSCNNNTTWWRKPWKRELGQYSLIKSCTKFPLVPGFLKLHFVSLLGLNIPKAGKRNNYNVKLSYEVQKAVVTFLKLHQNGPLLTKGSKSLEGNGLKEKLSWIENNKDTKIILIWHIATCFLEMDPSSKKYKDKSTKDHQSTKEFFNVATSLSNYCAYLLFFSSSLLPVPALEAELTCDKAIHEARDYFNKSSNFDKFEMMENYDVKQDEDRENQKQNMSVLGSGIKLGKQLVTLVNKEDTRWKILAKFWVEMILFLAPSNGNEMAHAKKLSTGGEFITHLWALLIHSGITDRFDMAA